MVFKKWMLFILLLSAGGNVLVSAPQDLGAVIETSEKISSKRDADRSSTLMVDNKRRMMVWGAAALATLIGSYVIYQVLPKLMPVNSEPAVQPPLVQPGPINAGSASPEAPEAPEAVAVETSKEKVQKGLAELRTFLTANPRGSKEYKAGLKKIKETCFAGLDDFDFDKETDTIEAELRAERLKKIEEERVARELRELQEKERLEKEKLAQLTASLTELHAFIQTHKAALTNDRSPASQQLRTIAKKYKMQPKTLNHYQKLFTADRTVADALKNPPK